MIEVYQRSEEKIDFYLFSMIAKRKPSRRYADFCVKIGDNFLGIMLDETDIRCYNTVLGEILEYDLYEFKQEVQVKRFDEILREVNLRANCFYMKRLKKTT